MYVVSLQGKDAFQRNDVICTITRMSNLDKVRVYLKQKHDIDFEKVSDKHTLRWRCFDNITDDRDISLIVERVFTEDDIDLLLS